MVNALNRKESIDSDVAGHVSSLGGLGEGCELGVCAESRRCVSSMVVVSRVDVRPRVQPPFIRLGCNLFI